MLYLIHRANHEALTYRGGQEPIVHLEANLNEAVVWAKLNQRMWAFTTSNASSFYFQEYSDLSRLEEIDWNAVRARDWRDCKEKKQAEFLVEHSFPWTLIRRIGVQSQTVFRQVQQAVQMARDNRPNVMIARKWYY